ncbi:DUF1737 domain-containing protein [bacterium]|nr:DUF1737 domain-containing protein [bacterium]
MSKITGYKILVADEVPQLEKDVLAHLKDGWEPIGGPFIVVVSTEGLKLTTYSSKPTERVTISQAMIRA